MPDPSGGYLGTSYPTPTDPSYYLSQVGLSGLTPQAFNADSMAAMFSPQGMQYTPVNNMATNPFLSLFMQDASGATKLQRKQVDGMDQAQGQGPMGGPG